MEELFLKEDVKKNLENLPRIIFLLSMLQIGERDPKLDEKIQSATLHKIKELENKGLCQLANLLNSLNSFYQVDDPICLSLFEMIENKWGSKSLKASSMEDVSSFSYILSKRIKDRSQIAKKALRLFTQTVVLEQNLITNHRELTKKESSDLLENSPFIPENDPIHLQIQPKVILNILYTFINVEILNNSAKILECGSIINPENFVEEDLPEDQRATFLYYLSIAIEKNISLFTKKELERISKISQFIKSNISGNSKYLEEIYSNLDIKLQQMLECL